MRKILITSLILLAAGCASNKPAPPLPETAQKPRPASLPSSVSDPEQMFRSCLNDFKSGNTETALRTIYRIQEECAATPWYKRSLFLEVLILIQSDRPSDADAAMLRVKTEYPEMADYAVSALADYHYSRRRFTQAAALYEQVAERYPRSSLAVRAFYRRGLALLESCSYAAAADVFEAFLVKHRATEFGADAQLALARSLLSEAAMDKAVQAFRDVWTRHPATPADQEAESWLALVGSSGIEVAPWTEDEWFERGRNLFRAARYDKAAETFGKLLNAYPNSRHRAEALFRTGVSRYYLGRRSESAAVLGRMIRDYPRDPRAPEALYWMGKSYSKLGERGKSVKTLAKIFGAHFDSEWADDALFLTGNIYREAGEMKKALQFYARLVRDYPDSRFADSALWWNSWAYYQAREYRKAEGALQDLVNRYPRSFLVPQAWYWQGRIAEKAGSSPRAGQLYRKLLARAPYTYYGYRAEERLRVLGEQDPVTDPELEPASDCTGEDCADDPMDSYDIDDGPPQWSEETRDLLAAEPSFRKTLELMHLDMKKEAAAELWHLQQHVPRKRGALIRLSKAFFELGDYYRSLVLVLRNYERYLDGETEETPDDLWLLAYPQGYWESILSWSRKYGQDPYFIAAIIREESQFHAEALSPAGARGVMQVMPATGEWIARTIRLSGFDRSKLFESDTAINLGTWYISHLMKRFKGDPLLTAAAYNAGPEAVAGWLGKNGIERDEFVEYIPYSETRGYVKKVMRNYAEYKRIYAIGRGAPRLNGLMPAEAGSMP